MSAVPFDMMENFTALEPALIGVIIALLVFYLIFLVFAIVCYVLRSLGLYTIAKRRGIHHPWLAWIPVGDAWIFGSISDQYQYVAKGKVRNRRKVLLGLNIAMMAMIVPVIIAEVATVLAMDSAVAAATAGMILFLAIYLAYIALAIVTTVFLYIAQYDLYQSCNPNNAVMFLVLGIFFSVTQPFFIFACRKKDLGMPPRKQPRPVVAELCQQEPAPEPETPVQDTVQTPEPTEEPAQPAPVLEDTCVADEADFAEEPTEAE